MQATATAPYQDGLPGCTHMRLADQQAAGNAVGISASCRLRHAPVMLLGCDYYADQHGGRAGGEQPDPGRDVDREITSAIMP